MVYLDSNVFVLASLAKDELGDSAKHILANLEKIDAKTSSLTFDEVAWAVLRAADIQVAVKACRALLALKHLEVIPVTHGDMWEMTGAMEKWELRPRDGLHLATMKRLSEESIVTEDTRFDKVDVKRISIKTFAESI